MAGADQLLTIEQVSEWLQVPVATLRNWRKHPSRAGAQPLPSLKLGNHLRYRRGDVDEWLEANTSARGVPVRRLRRGA